MRRKTKFGAVKKKTITFRPDPDVLEMLQEAMRATGQIQTTVINELARKGAARYLEQRQAGLGNESRFAAIVRSLDTPNELGD